MKELKSMRNINKGETDIFASFFMLGLGILAVIAIFIAVQDLGNGLEEIAEKEREIHTETFPLQSINTTTRTSGSSFHYFTYGVGQLNEKDYYVAYRIFEDGGKELYKMNAANTRIYETLDVDAQAYVEVDTNGYGTIMAYRLYVPQGSIEQKYDLSLE